MQSIMQGTVGDYVMHIWDVMSCSVRKTRLGLVKQAHRYYSADANNSNEPTIQEIVFASNFFLFLSVTLFLFVLHSIVYAQKYKNQSKNCQQNKPRECPS